MIAKGVKTGGGGNTCQPYSKKCPYGKPTATWCYGSGKRMQKLGGGAKAKDWCSRRANEGCGCSWVATKRLWPI